MFSSNVNVGQNIVGEMISRLQPVPAPAFLFLGVQMMPMSANMKMGGRRQSCRLIFADTGFAVTFLAKQKY